MAYVKGPLMSQSASGQIAEEIIFQTYNGRTYAKAYAVPGNTPGHAKMNQTPAQLAVQALTKSLMQAWPSIAPADKATWDTLALPKRISRVNAYLRYNYARNAIGLDPSDVYPPLTSPPQPLLFFAHDWIELSLSHWHSTHASNGQLTLSNGDLYSTPDVIEISYQHFSASAGTVDVTGFPLLETLSIPETYPIYTPDLSQSPSLKSLNLSTNHLPETPDLSACPQIQTLDISDNSLITPPDLDGLSELLSVNLSYNDLTEVDSVFIELAESADITAFGYCDTSLGESAAPTAASAAARDALSTGTGNWTLAYN